MLYNFIIVFTYNKLGPSMAATTTSPLTLGNKDEMKRDKTLELVWVVLVFGTGLL